MKIVALFASGLLIVGVALTFVIATPLPRADPPIAPTHPSVLRQNIPLDTTPPISTMIVLPPFSSRTFSIAWSATDETSGVECYDVQVRTGETGAWTFLLNRSTLTQTTFDGAPGEEYFFRVRAIDVAGNVEAWRAYDTFTSIPQTD